MKIKQKICAGWDNNTHPAFIYKNISGKKYCKVCAFRLEKKSIKAVSPKQKLKIEKKKENTEILHEWFRELWDKLPKDKFCTICDKSIFGENLSIYWDHLIERSKFPEYALEEWNVCFLCSDCHSSKTMGHPKPKHKTLIEEAYNHHIKNKFGIVK